MPTVKHGLQLVPAADEADLGAQECAEVKQGALQQESIRFSLPEAVDGLRCVKKYAVGELCWDQVVEMGDFGAGEHSYAFEESEVPRGTLTLGQYRMKTVRFRLLCHARQDVQLRLSEWYPLRVTANGQPSSCLTSELYGIDCTFRHDSSGIAQTHHWPPAFRPACH